MKLEISAISDKGKVRDINEDMLLIGENIFRDTTSKDTIPLDATNPVLLFAVADGMGGHNAGEIASEILVQEFLNYTKKLKSEIVAKELNEEELSINVKKVANEIHRKILNEGLLDPTKKGMGSTFAGLLYYCGNFYNINVGDSRLYRLRDKILMQISKDHSMQEATGNMDLPKNIILSSFGGGENITIDFKLASKKIITDDTFLLCSDGLSDGLSLERMENILNDEKDPLSKLFKEAMENGSEDNISIIIIRIKE